MSWFAICRKDGSGMKKHLVSALGAMGVGLAFVTAMASGQTLVWSDEFAGPAIDHSTWTYKVGGHGFGNGELQFHTAQPENAYIDSGNLVIEAREGSYIGNNAFTSARLATHGRFAFKYGTLEARIKLPDVDYGMWPAFWLLGNNVGQFTWPACGELDIMEVGSHAALLDGVVNQRVNSGVFWDYQGSQANYGGHIDWPTLLYQDYHVFSVEWTPAHIRTFVDGLPSWEIDISDPNGASLEEFHAPMYIIANVSVGGWNFIEITDPALITAPFPGRMYIDYVRLYDNGDTELYFAEDIAETGNFGVFTENTPVDNQVTYDVDTSLYLWNNLTPGTGAAYEGDEAWHMTANAGAWFGMGVYTHFDRNMQNYSDGHLHFHMKTASPAHFRIGLKSSAAGESWVDFGVGEEIYGLVRDGEWHEVVIPLNAFLNVDFNTIGQVFMIAGDPPASTFDFSLDNVYWSPSVPRPTPTGGTFGIYTEDPAHKTAGEYLLGADGGFYVWDGTLVPAEEHPYEGDACLSLQSAPGMGWFGAAFTPIIKYDLSAYDTPGSALHVALKTSSTTPFYLGMRSGNVNDVGQKWILFENGNDPYGLVRDGQWHVLEIPMEDFSDAVDLSQVSMLFELLGVSGAISSIEIDDIHLVPGAPSGCRGDANCDGTINWRDIDYFVAGQNDNVSAWEALFTGPPPCPFANNDVNEDGTVNWRDIDPFVAVQNTTCP